MGNVSFDETRATIQDALKGVGSLRELEQQGVPVVDGLLEMMRSAPEEQCQAAMNGLLSLSSVPESAVAAVRSVAKTRGHESCTVMTSWASWGWGAGYADIPSPVTSDLSSVAAEVLTVLAARVAARPPGPAPAATPAPTAPAPAPAPRPVPKEPAIVQLDEQERAKLLEAIRTQAPPAVALLGDAKEVDQPWWTRHRLVEIMGHTPQFQTFTVAIDPDGKYLLLLGHIETIRVIAKRKPPRHLEDEANAEKYARRCEVWTNAEHQSERGVESTFHLPTGSVHDARQRALIRELDARFGTVVRRAGMVSTAEGWVYRRWLVSKRRLIQRDIMVPENGYVERRDTVLATDLPW